MDQPANKIISKWPKGVPLNHPSIGRSMRDPVDGPSWPLPSDHGGGRIITPHLEFAWGFLLAVWIYYSRFFFISLYFRDPDSARIAFGVAEKLQGLSVSQASLWHFEKISGTYYLFELLCRLFSIQPSGLQDFLSCVCAAFMVGILIINFSLAYMIWGKRVALLSTTLLSISPMMWLTGEYITSIIPAFFFFMSGVWAMVLSYRAKGGRIFVILSSLLFALAILIRGDMILGVLVPICYAYFVDRRGLRRAFIIYVLTAIFFLACWYFAVGRHGYPLINTFSPAHPHMPNYGKSLVINFVGMGPFLFIFAFIGFLYRFITDRRPLPFIFFWIVLFNTYYTGHLYSPRNFIPYYPPVAWLAAFSLIALYSRLVKIVKYNRPVRVLLIFIFVAGALSMFTTSFIVRFDSVGNKSTRLAWGEYDLLIKRDGYFPTGSAWFYMQKFKNGEDQLFSWLEDAVVEFAGALKEPESESPSGNFVPVYYGSESQVFLNYELIRTGWRVQSNSDNYVFFVRDGYGPGHTLSTSYVYDPVLEYTNRRGTFRLNENLDKSNIRQLTEPRDFPSYIGMDAIPRLIAYEQMTGMAPLNDPRWGWSVVGNYGGLDVVRKGVSGTDDGCVGLERWILESDGDIQSGWWIPGPHFHSENPDLYGPIPPDLFSDWYKANLLSSSVTNTPNSGIIGYVPGPNLTSWEVYRSYEGEIGLVNSVASPFREELEYAWILSYSFRPYDYFD